MLISARTLREGYKIPCWYGFAYFEPAMGRYVCYPIPFHWLLRLGRQLWWAFLMPRAKTKEMQTWERKREEEYTAGYNRGRAVEKAQFKELIFALGLTALPKEWLESGVGEERGARNVSP